MPLHAVETSYARTAGWLMADSEISYWSTTEGLDPRSLPLHERFSQKLTTARRTWQGADVLRVFPADQPYHVLHFFDQGRFAGWYVNFETPARWVGAVRETRDWHLDLVVAPDGKGQWKDEEEADAAVEHGHLHASELALARRVGDEILADFDAWLAHVGDWRAARPGQDMGPLPLPSDWDRER
jgi:hypothetical protein